MAKETILVLCAHNDDQVLGAGGTLAKYASEGKRVRTIIFAFGEKSHPYLKPELVIETRMKEALASDKIFGGSGIAYLGLEEGNFTEGIKKKGIKEKIKFLIKQEKPSKIFTHSSDDPHPDHNATYALVMDILKKTKLDCEVYSFDVWNPINIRQQGRPKLVVDITKTFETKMKAINAHKSQKLALFSLVWSVYVKAILNGWNNNCKYAEVFYRLN